MTFDELHNGLGKKCQCLELGPAVENPADVFLRVVKNNPPIDDDFRSYEEEGEKLPNKKCVTRCKFRGISMDKVDDTNEHIVKQRWAERVANKPKKFGKHFFKFRVINECGLVWATPSNNNKYHYTLLRSDTFAVEQLETVEVGEL